MGALNPAIPERRIKRTLIRCFLPEKSPAVSEDTAFGSAGCVRNGGFWYNIGEQVAANISLIKPVIGIGRGLFGEVIDPITGFSLIAFEGPGIAIAEIGRLSVGCA